MIRFTYKLHGPHYPDATLTLTWEQRAKSRQRVMLDNGIEAGLFLQRGSILAAGDLLASEDGIVVEVRAAAEPLTMVDCRDSIMLARACYHLGNRHAAVEIADGQIRYLRDPVLDEMVKGLGLDVRHAEGPFETEVGA
jgi:urease accessory protein